MTGLNTPVQVTLYSTGDTISALPAECKGPKIDEKANYSAPGRLVSAANLSNPGDGAFRVLLLGEDCSGVYADVEAKQGTVALASETENVASKPPTNDGTASEPIVRVTIKQGTEPWKTARGVCDIAVGADLQAVGILHSATEDDGKADGPFSVTIVDNDICPGVSLPLDVDTGGGTYAPIAN